VTQGKVLPLRRIAGNEAELSDESLVAACVLADRAALGALFDRFHEGVYRFLARLCGSDGSELDDLVQATFLEVPRAARRFRGGSSVRTWIFGIAANHARHHVRSERRRGAMLSAVAREARDDDHAPPPDVQVGQRQLLDRLQRAMESLSHDQRAVFVLCDVESVPGVEAARALGVREGTLWRRLHEARKRLREALGGAR
jgi:RNA polymerase sigma-70 factor (ECF subfamily)